MRYKNAGCPAVHSTVLQNNPNSIWHTVHKVGGGGKGEQWSKPETKFCFTSHTVLFTRIEYTLNFLGMELLCKLRETLPRIALHFRKSRHVQQCHLSYLSGQYNTPLLVCTCRFAFSHSVYKYKPLILQQNVHLKSNDLHLSQSVARTFHWLIMF